VKTEVRKGRQEGKKEREGETEEKEEGVPMYCDSPSTFKEGRKEWKEGMEGRNGRNEVEGRT
jgi:hypothetical protein